MPSTKKQKKRKVVVADSAIESSVMREIYGLERKKTTFLFAEFALLIFIFLLLGISFSLLVISLMNQGEVFDMFQLFAQDPETIRQYFWDTMHTIYLETPKEYLLLALIFLTGATLLVFAFKRQLPTLLQKLQSIRRFAKRYQ